MSLKFSKYVGAGNDFIFIKHSEVTSCVDRTALAIQLCEPKWGIGADGLVIVKPLNLEKSEFEWDFYNNDGSTAEMCGNAARCAVLYVKNEFNLNECQLLTKAGWVSGNILNTETTSTHWTIESTQPQYKQISLSSDKEINGHFINTGVPHFVVETEDLSGQDCLLIQNHPEFAPQKTNITLLWTQEKKHFTKSFERGVRRFTLACGTGVLAAACVLKSKLDSNSHNLTTPGGNLRVDFLETSVMLSGPAKRIFTGQIY